MIGRDGAGVRVVAWLFIALVLVLGAPPAVASAADVGISVTATRTDAQVCQMWSQLNPSYSGGPYAVSPSVAAPYAPGALNAAFLADGLGIINFGRFLAGVPSDVTLDAVRNADAQYGAVLLAASTFSHAPPRPADMPVSFYDRGVASTSRSNIGYGLNDSESFQLLCLADKDSGNIAALGHRRWLINPQMLKTGIGFAGSRHTTYAFDRSRAEQLTYSVIAYPSAGPFPVDGGFFDTTTPWSITLNPARYDWDGTGHTVTLKRVSDGKSWTFTAADTNTSDEYFGFNTEGYGVPNAFIFRPAPSSVGAYRAGDEFDVTLSGGIYAEGTRTPATVSYRTRFMSLASGGTTDPTATLERLYGATRYSTAVAIAREAYPGWTGVKNVVIAAGDDRAASDPLAASGLCWAYDAPLLLVPSTHQSAETIAAIREIVAANGPVKLRVVGGSGALPDARIDEIIRGVGVSSVTADRIIDSGDRYDLARAIANRMKEVAASDPGKTMPDAVLLANGADSACYFDALALSPIAAAKGVPILLVRQGSVPDATRAAIDDLGNPATVIIAGGSGAVSEAVSEDLGAARWAGLSRFETAVAVANGAIAKGWLSGASVGVAAALPDALAGGSLAGVRGGVLLLTGGTTLAAPTRAWIEASQPRAGAYYLFGGPGVASDAVVTGIVGALE